jgi:hypothetical protein
VEDGPLNANIDNATASLSVVNSFLAWEAIPTATITYTNRSPLVEPGTQIPIDVDETNFFLVLGVQDDQSPIIFDDDGDLFRFLGLPPGVLGIGGVEIMKDGCPFAILEGLVLLNGPAFGSDLDYAEAVMVHEFGHFSNLAHTVVNGQSFFFGDDTGPTPFDPLGFGPAPADAIETMYPFLDAATVPFIKKPHADDIAALSTIYPAAAFPGSAGTIRGKILRPDGLTGITGVNVIARKVDNPFGSAVSAISGDFTQGAGTLGLNDGLYTINGLPAGNDYVVYIDQILAGGFSTPLAPPFTEEFYNGGWPPSPLI